MLAKPEYFSPPDEVCCWPRRRGETVAGRGADADGWGLPGRDATIDTEGVAVKAAGGVLILIKNSVALGKYLGICWIF